MEEMQKYCKKRLINTQTYGIPLYALESKDLFRYIPNRALMQRLIRRTTQLPEYITTFEPDLSAFRL